MWRNRPPKVVISVGELTNDADGLQISRLDIEGPPADVQHVLAALLLPRAETSAVEDEVNHVGQA